jgi:hypothetical protein
MRKNLLINLNNIYISTILKKAFFIIIVVVIFLIR